jgi:DNA-binding NtrC family response regulator/pSer/pThr/pTyr-binding forkhead associated (FHA) protein
LPAPDPQETLATERARGSAGPPRQRYLVVFAGDSSNVLPLPDGGELVVGRGDEAGLRLDDAKVSRRHARFVLGGDVVTVADLESQNGTFVNGEPVVAPRVLLSGDVVEIGRASLVFHAAPRTAGGGIDFESFRRLVDDEIERSSLSVRPLALAALLPDGGDAGTERAAQLLSAEVVGVERLAHDGGRLLVLLPEADAAEAFQRVHELVQLLAAGGIGCRAAVALHPADGCDSDALLSTARSSVREAQPGAIVGAQVSTRTLEIGGTHVLVADPAMLRLYALIERLAASDLPVLVHGETGAGKELAARALHFWSRRRSARLVAVNCGALQETLAESELFGHERGAFTGAVAAKPGLLEAAQGGTVFFDEIGDLPLAIQVKLLRALDTGRVIRVGDVVERSIDVRVVAATHKNLEQEVAQGRFRQDLYFRLSGATLWLPPLRNRPRELALLARRFLGEARARLGRPAMQLSDEALRLLSSHPWPGNVRELENVMEFVAAAYDDAVIDAWQVAERLGQTSPVAERRDSAAAPPPSPFRSLDDEVRELERARILQALEAAGGNQRRAAQMIGMPLRTLVSKLTRYGLRQR